MGFRDRTQENAAIALLLERTIGKGYWSLAGQTSATPKNPAANTMLGLACALLADPEGNFRISSESTRLGEVNRLLPAWRMDAYGLLGAFAEGPSGVDRWMLTHALEITGKRLRAMHTADPARWKSLLLEGLAHASSKPDLAAIYGVDLKTVYLWLDEAGLREEAGKRFRKLRAHGKVTT